MKLRGITWDHPRGYDCLIAASRQYAREHAIEIGWDKRSLQAFADAPIDELAAKYDLIVFDHPHVGLIAKAGALEALDFEPSGETSLGGSEESYVWGGACWARAIDASCQMAVCRPDLVAKIPRLPQLWEDFLGEDARQYRALTPLLPVDAFDMFLTLVASRGEVAHPHNSREFTSPQNGAYALEVLRALYQTGPDEQVDMNPIRVLETLATSDEFALSPCLFGYVNYARPDFRTHQLSYFDLPKCAGQDRPRAILGGAGIGVSAQSSARAEAKAFAHWLASEPVQSGVYLENEGQPANRLSWLARAKDPDMGGFFKNSYYTISNAWARPREPWFLGFVDDVCAIMPDFFRRQIPVDRFLGEMNGLYQKHRVSA